MALLLFQALPRGLPASVEPAQVRGGHGVTGGGGLGAAVPRTVPPGEGQGAGSTGKGAREQRGAAPGGAGGGPGAGGWGFLVPPVGYRLSVVGSGVSWWCVRGL